MENEEPQIIVNLSVLKAFHYESVEVLTAMRVLTSRLYDLSLSVSRQCEAHLQMLQRLEVLTAKPENPNEPKE